MSTTTILLPLLLITAALTTTATATAIPTPPSLPTRTPTPTTTFISAILATLNFNDLSAAAAAATNLTTPATIFAPSDTSLASCPSCSIPLLLQELTIPGLYPIHFLRNLAFATKIESFAPSRCLTLTATPPPPSPSSSKSASLFVNGVKITKPDLFNNGLIIVHGIKGYLSHLSPLSCSIETMTTLSFSQLQNPATSSFATTTTSLMMKEAMMKLRMGGYSITALSMRFKHQELSELNSMTIFAIDDESIFIGEQGHEYVAQIGFHVVPNRLLEGAELMGLRTGTVLPTLEHRKSLMVTSMVGGTGPVSAMRINYVKVERFDVVCNERVVVHGLTRPFLQLRDDDDESVAGQSWAEFSKFMVRASMGNNVRHRRYRGL